MGFYQRRVFPALCDLATRPFEKERRRIIPRAEGRVLEIGIGHGRNLRHYSPRVTEVLGIEVSESMLHKTRERADRIRQRSAECPVFDLRLGDATSLAFGADEFDAVVSFLVFCSLPEPSKSAAEIFRVLKPGGTLLIFEHVVARDPRLERWQARLNPLWSRLSCGCNLNRDTRSEFERAGFDCDGTEEFMYPHSMKLASPTLRGVAVKPT